MNRMNRLRSVLAVVALSAVLAAGCGKRGPDQSMLKGLVEQYIVSVASRDFVSANETLTGDALMAFQGLVPLLEALEYESQVSGLAVTVLRSDKQGAELEASYVLTQTLPDLGTSVQQYRVRYWLAPVGDVWRIFRIAIVEQTDTGGN